MGEHRSLVYRVYPGVEDQETGPSDWVSEGRPHIRVYRSEPKAWLFGGKPGYRFTGTGLKLGSIGANLVLEWALNMCSKELSWY